MKIKDIVENLDLLPERETILAIKKEANSLIKFLDSAIKELRISADVFIGGSLAKNTMVKKEVYEVDIFVRFDWRYKDISIILEKILNNLKKKNGKFTIRKIHGSRDYFSLIKDKRIIFEIIPVTKIKHSGEARNITDLSYFHINYVKSHINSEISRQIAITKTFCRACGVYGAESYIHGFSGYAIECLLIHYKTFENLARMLVKQKERLILDPKKHYKKINDVLFTMNESKLQSPIILVDPTWKGRNVLASLSNETYHKFQKSLLDFLKKPNLSFFKFSQFSPSEMEKKARKFRCSLTHIIIKTNKQAGDIAGTKLKKFSNFVSREISQYFQIKESLFVYDEKQKADIYFITKSLPSQIKQGPSLDLKKHARGFKRAHKNTFTKSNVLYTKLSPQKSFPKFLEKFKKERSKTLRDMDIIGFEIKKRAD